MVVAIKFPDSPTNVRRTPQLVRKPFEIKASALILASVRRHRIHKDSFDVEKDKARFPSRTRGQIADPKELSR